MGFMDKAKKLAEQAQEKLDDAQKNFNQGQGGSGSQPAQGGVKYDEHGRPIQEETPAAAAPPPAAAPAPAPTAPAESATGGPPADAPAEEEAPPPAPTPAPEQSQGSGGANASPDPFKPLQQ